MGEEGCARTFRTFQISALGHRRAHESGMYGSVSTTASGGGRSSSRSSISNPHERSSRIMSPCPRWYSMASTTPFVVVPLEAMHPEVVAMELRVGGRFVVVRREAEHHEWGNRLEHEAPAGTQDPRGLGDPPIRVAPVRGPVLGDREVEALVGEGRSFGVRVHEREVQRELLLERPGGPELARRVVETDHACAAAHQPRGDEGGPAAEFDRSKPGDVGQHMDLGLEIPSPPDGFLRCPRFSSSFDPVRGIRIP